MRMTGIVLALAKIKASNGNSRSRQHVRSMQGKVSQAYPAQVNKAAHVTPKLYEYAAVPRLIVNQG